jgi:hypothetical protein
MSKQEISKLVKEKLKKEYPFINIEQNYEDDIKCSLCFFDDTEKNEEYKVEVLLQTYKDININVKIYTRDKSSYINLEKLKINIKNILKKLEGTNECYWIKDLQVEKFAVELYADIHKLENKFRSFINTVLCNALGCLWFENIKKFIGSELGAKYGQNKGSMRQLEKLNDVNDFLFSLDTGDLLKIVELKGKELNRDKIDQLENHLLKLKNNNNIESFFTNIEKLKEIKIDLWNRYFKFYLNENFKENWKNFNKNRNHIMHNKPIDSSAFKKIKENFNKILEELDKAESKYLNQNLSVEDMETFEEEKWIEEQHRIDEAGITISGDVIYDVFSSKLSELIEVFNDYLYFRTDITTETISCFLEDIKYYEVYFSLEERDKIRLTLEKKELNINLDLGGISSFELVAFINGKEVSSLYMCYTNPTIEYHEDGTNYMPASEGILESYDEESFIKNIKEEIYNSFLTPSDEIDNYYAKNEIYPVYEESCPNCGEFTVSNTDDFYKKGFCINCGEEYEVEVCEGCNRSTLEVDLIPWMDYCTECQEDWMDRND